MLIAYTEERITPTQAMTWLQYKDTNRKISQADVEKYARDMLSGRWLLNGECLKFDENGLLIDGEHRLWAVVEANIAVTMGVQRGVPRSHRATIGVGRQPTISQRMQMEGIQYTNTVVAACRWLTFIKMGTNRWADIRLSRGEVDTILARHKKLQDFCATHHNRGRKELIGPSLAATLDFICTTFINSGEEFEEFCVVLMTGNPTFTGCPAHAWRERLLRYRLSKSVLRELELCAGTIWAWNKFTTHTPVRAALIPDRPKIVGLDVNLL